MSTATAFLSISYFPDCPQTVTTLQANKYYNFQWIGPLSLEDAMKFYWNLEVTTFSINGINVTVVSVYQPYTTPTSFPKYPEPYKRVCLQSNWYGENEAAAVEIDSRIGVYGGNYYLGVQAEYFFEHHVTGLGINAPTPDWIAAATYSGTIYGYAVTWYRFWFSDYYPTYSGADDGQITGSFYTY